MKRLVILAAALATAAPVAGNAADYAWPVVRMIDGDTVAVDASADMPPELAEVRVRLRGVDAPETGHRAECDAGARRRQGSGRLRRAEDRRSRDRRGPQSAMGQVGRACRSGRADRRRIARRRARAIPSRPLVRQRHARRLVPSNCNPRSYQHRHPRLLWSISQRHGWNPGAFRYDRRFWWKSLSLPALH